MRKALAAKSASPHDGASDDLITPSHGAIVIPYEIAAKVPEAAGTVRPPRDADLDIARSKDFSLEKLKKR